MTVASRLDAGGFTGSDYPLAGAIPLNLTAQKGPRAQAKEE